MLLLVYGLNTWLAELMKDAGYPLGSSLAFLGTLNLGAIVGAISAGRAADRFGAKRVTSVGFLVGAVAIALLALKPPQAVVFALLFVGGYGTIGTAMIVNAYVTEHYPAANRATAIGWSLGIGRTGAILGPTLGGILIGAGIALEWNFYVFALVAVAAIDPVRARPTPTGAGDADGPLHTGGAQPSGRSSHGTAGSAALSAWPNSGHASLRHSHSCSGPPSASLAGWPHEGHTGAEIASLNLRTDAPVRPRSGAARSIPRESDRGRRCGTRSASRVRTSVGHSTTSPFPLEEQQPAAGVERHPGKPAPLRGKPPPTRLRERTSQNVADPALLDAANMRPSGENAS